MSHAKEIVERLWLGYAHASMDETFLRAHHIDVVMNCTKELPFSHVSPMVQYRVPLDDNLEEAEIRNAGLWSSEIVLTLMKHYKKGDRILVHCFAGRQRSAASVAMFLILLKGFRTEEAIAYIREKRSIAFFPQANFGRSIQMFEERYQKEILPAITGLHL